MAFQRHYPLTGLRNARDLGGYTATGGVTRWGVFLRSDLPRDVTEADRARLRALDIRLDVDLRGDKERSVLPDELEGAAFLTYRALPMLGVTAAAGRDRPGGKTAFDGDFSWGAEYVRMVEGNKPWARDCVELLAHAEGGALFHCFTGKDRTGILAALLLGLCGVGDGDIAADYCVSSLYLGDVYRWMTAHIPDFRDRDLTSPFFSTGAENILTLQRHLRENYGGAAGYLADCGLPADAAARLRERLVKNT